MSTRRLLITVAQRQPVAEASQRTPGDDPSITHRCYSFTDAARLRTRQSGGIKGKFVGTCMGPAASRRRTARLLIGVLAAGLVLATTPAISSADADPDAAAVAPDGSHLVSLTLGEGRRADAEVYSAA